MATFAEEVEDAGFAVAMAVDPAVAAPVLCQPSAPFPVGRTRAADVNLSPGDLDVVKGRCAAGQQEAVHAVLAFLAEHLRA